jgi:ubiquinone/menaquinone biosynthesis C-methylase UbiE
MDAEHLDFPDAAFDCVLCGFGVMFFPNQDQALGEFRRVLKSGGRLGVSTWHATQSNEIEAVLTEFGMRPPRQPGWITEPEDLSRLLTRTGFADVRVTTDTHSFRYSGIDEYWQQARGTGMRRVLDALDAVQAQRIRAALAERMRPNQRPDGIYSAATALIAVATR